MRVIESSVRRPISVIMFTLMGLLVGIYSYIHLPIDLMPNIDYPALSIVSKYPEATAEEVEKRVTEVLEEAVVVSEGLLMLKSESREGQSELTAEFDWGVNLTDIMYGIQSRLEHLKGRLPKEAEPPILYKFNMSEMPIMWIAVSANMDRALLRAYTEKYIKRQFEQIDGLAQADIGGAAEREIHINIHYQQLQSKSITLNEINQALIRSNKDQTLGRLEGDRNYTLKSVGRLKTLEDIGDIIIRTIGNTHIKIKDVAEVKDSFKKSTTLVRNNRQNSIILMLIKSPQANTVQLARSIKALLRELQETHPRIKLQIIRDASLYIEDALSNTQRTLIVSGIITILVLIVCLGSLRNALIVGCSMLVSVVLAFFFMEGFNFTLNMISFGGIALGIGMLVDNSIIVMENMTRYRAGGLSSVDASLRGTSEVAVAIWSSTMTSVLVFIPFFFLEGALFAIFRQLAYMVVISLGLSLIVAITVIPALNVQFHRNTRSKTRIKYLQELFDTLLERLKAMYIRALQSALAIKGKFLCVTLCGCVALFFLTPLLQFDFMPVTEEHEIMISGSLPHGTNIHTTYQRFQDIEHTIYTNYHDIIENIFARIGLRSGEHTGFLFLRIKKEAKKSTEELAQEIQTHMSKYTDMKSYVRAFSFLRRMFTDDDDGIEIQLRGYDLHKAEQLSQTLMHALSRIPGVSDIRSSREYGHPEYKILLKRDRIEEQALSINEISEFLRNALTGSIVTKFSAGEYQYDIRVRIHPDELNTLESIKRLSYLYQNKEQRILLKSLLDIEPSVAPLAIERINQQRVVYLRGGTQTHDIASLLKSIKKVLQSIQIPEDFQVTYGGILKEQEQGYSELLISIVCAVVLVYMFLAGQFESFRMPCIIILTVPLSFSGVILCFYLFNLTFTVQAMIGVAILSGIVVNNSIVLVDHVHSLKSIPVEEAIMSTADLKLRPILMTTATTVFALLPLILSSGDGSELQVPMAAVLCSGLLFALFVSLFVIPCFYALLFYKNRPTREV